MLVADLAPATDRPLYRLSLFIVVLVCIAMAFGITASTKDSKASITLTSTQKNHALIELETSRVLNLVRARLNSDQRYTAAVSRLGSELHKTPSPERLEDYLGQFARETAKSVEAATRAEFELEQAHVTIQALRSSLEQATEVALRDPLTSIGNRRAFDLYVDQSIKSCSSRNESLALVMCDLDHFKRINDTYGHQAGDEVIRLFAGNVVANVRGSDLVCRYGGEEFVVVLPRTDAAEASILAERIRSVVEKQRLALKHSGEEIAPITASFGVTHFRRGEQLSHFVRRADEALYASKTGGRNRVSLL